MRTSTDASRSSRACCDDAAGAHDQTHSAEVLDALEGVAVDRDHVSRSTRFEDRRRHRCHDLLGRHADDFVQQERLADVDPRRDRTVPQIGPVDDDPAGGSEPSEVVAGSSKLRRDVAAMTPSLSARDNGGRSAPDPWGCKSITRLAKNL